MPMPKAMVATIAGAFPKTSADAAAADH
jgi:hypothetical protein